MELDGYIVEFVDSGALRIGYVRKREQRKLRIIDQRGRQSSVPASRVVVIHGVAHEADFRETANEINKRVEQSSAEIDAELLWQSVQTEPREFTPAELAEAYFGRTSPEAESAIFRKLAHEPLFFKRKGTEFQPRSVRQVASERLRVAHEQEDERFRKHVTDLLGQALEGGEPDDADWEELLGRLEKWLRHRERDEIGTILEKIVGESRARDIAYDLLARAGRVGASEDRFLVIRGVSTTFPAETRDACDGLNPYSNEGSREDRTGRVTLAIDDEDTVEVDDALTVNEADGNIVIGIHVADVSVFVTKDDALDREAYRRSATIYLPNISVTMFPERLSTDLASLVDGKLRPAFSVEARFDQDDTLVDFHVLQTVVQVTDQLSYEAADRRLAEGHAALGHLHRIAQHLRDSRTEQGAMTHRRPEIKVRVRDGDVSVRRLETNTPSRLIVSEMMILANSLAADQAAAMGTPVIFRTQEPPDDTPPETEGLPEAVQFELLRKSFKRFRLSLSPAPHSGLGLTAYTQMSSPIRRYADLITQRQFAAALSGQPLPYDRKQLLRILTSAEAAELEIRRLEQASTNYWILTYLSREMMGQPMSAIAVDRKGTVELTDYLIRGKVSDAKEWQMGDSVTVEIESVDPVKGKVRFRTSV